jgi:K+-sensing histidine kinase KdpD
MSKGKVKQVVDTLVGILFAASTAAIVSLLFHGTNLRTTVPLLFLGMITVVALRYGIAAGVIGSLVAVFIFAFFLFTPAGSLAVAGDAARANLGWLLLGGVTLSFFFAPRQHD